MLQKLFGTVFNKDVPDTPSTSRLVASLPVPLRTPLGARAPGLLTTAETFRRIMEGAKRSVKIFSPYVEPTFTKASRLRCKV